MTTAPPFLPILNDAGGGAAFTMLGTTMRLLEGYGHAGDPFKRSYRVRVLRVRQVDRTNGFRREVSGTRR